MRLKLCTYMCVHIYNYVCMFHYTCNCVCVCVCLCVCVYERDMGHAYTIVELLLVAVDFFKFFEELSSFEVCQMSNNSRKYHIIRQ